MGTDRLLSSAKEVDEEEHAGLRHEVARDAGDSIERRRLLACSKFCTADATL